MPRSADDKIYLELSAVEVEALINASNLPINYAALQSLQSDELLQKLLGLKTTHSTEIKSIKGEFSMEEVLLMKTFASHGEEPKYRVLGKYLDEVLHQAT